MLSAVANWSSVLITRYPLFLQKDADMHYKSSDSSLSAIGSESTPSSSRRIDTPFGPTESRVRIVLTGQSDKSSQKSKARPVWMADSTINSGPMAGENFSFAIVLDHYRR